MLANREVFEHVDNRFNDADDEHECDVKQTFGDKGRCPVVLIASNVMNCTKIFPVVKQTRNDNYTNEIEQIYLIKHETNCKTFGLQGNERMDDSKLLEAFFIYSEEFSEKRDYLVICRRRSIKIYDNEQKLKLEIRGLNIKNCINVHQGYLYSISCNVGNPPTITSYDHGMIVGT